MKIYLIVFEDNTAKYFLDDPTRQDKECADDGTINIFRIEQLGDSLHVTQYEGGKWGYVPISRIEKQKNYRKFHV